jgi:hypothetical protein
MVVGLLTANLHMQGVASLKEKRGIVKSLIGRLKSRFNVSVSEVDHQDQRNSAVIAVTVVSAEGRFVDQQLDALITFMKADGRFYLGRLERQLL